MTSLALFAWTAALARMLKGVYVMKRILLVGVLLAALMLLKQLVPPNCELQRKTMAFLGLERDTVQTIGQSADKKADWQSVFSADP